MNMHIFELISDNLSGMGYMGQSPSRNYNAQFATLAGAKQHAQNEYNRSRRDEKITWKRLNNKAWTSGDLGFVSYRILKRKVNP